MARPALYQGLLRVYEDVAVNLQYDRDSVGPRSLLLRESSGLWTEANGIDMQVRLGH